MKWLSVFFGKFVLVSNCWIVGGLLYDVMCCRMLMVFEKEVVFWMGVLIVVIKFELRIWWRWIVGEDILYMLVNGLVYF